MVVEYLDPIPIKIKAKVIKHFVRRSVMPSLQSGIRINRRGATGAGENKKFVINSLLIQNCNIFENDCKNVKIEQNYNNI